VALSRRVPHFFQIRFGPQIVYVPPQSFLASAVPSYTGTLYNPSDYPSSLAGLFGIEFDFPSVEPPSYLQQLNPALFEQECQRLSLCSHFAPATAQCRPGPSHVPLAECRDHLPGGVALHGIAQRPSGR